MRASLDFGQHVPRSYAIKYASITLISARNLIGCAHRKKLAWLLRQCDATVLQGEAKCIHCGQKPGIFVTCIGSCALCKRALCASCRTKIELGDVTERGSLVTRKLWLCTFCLDKASETSSRKVARAEYVGTRGGTWRLWTGSPTLSSFVSNSNQSDEEELHDLKRGFNVRHGFDQGVGLEAQF